MNKNAGKRQRNVKKVIKALISILFIVIGGVFFYPFFFPIKVTWSSLPYEYTIHGTYIEINRYTGDEEIVVIPASICFRPVRMLGKKNVHEEGVFRANANVKEIYMPDSVTEIGFYCFFGCTGLEKVRISPNVKKVGEFCGCTSLRTIEIPEGVEEIMLKAFLRCSNLEEVRLPQTLNTIGVYAFDQCINLKEINLPDSLEKIESCSFRDCEKLESIIIPNSVKEIAGNAFRGTAWEKTWEGEFGIGGNNVLIYYKGDQEKVEVPDGVEYVGERLFVECKNMRQLILPESVKKSDMHIAAACDNLEYLVIKNPNMVFPHMEVSGWPDMNAIYDGDGDICIVGEKGSTAEAYAEEMGYAFSESLPEDK